MIQYLIYLIPFGFISQISSGLADTAEEVLTAARRSQSTQRKV